jgi:hypothetical protein
MKVGLGSDTTSRWFIQTLGDRVKQGLEVIDVPTSNSTRDLAIQIGVPVADLNDVRELDLATDGPLYNALMRENQNRTIDDVIATATRRLWHRLRSGNRDYQVPASPIPRPRKAGMARRSMQSGK